MFPITVVGIPVWLKAELWEQVICDIVVAGRHVTVSVLVTVVVDVTGTETVEVAAAASVIVAVPVIVDWDSVTVAVVVFVGRDEGMTMNADRIKAAAIIKARDPRWFRALLKPRSGCSDMIPGCLGKGSKRFSATD
jgi:hypothetical protein